MTHSDNQNTRDFCHTSLLKSTDKFQPAAQLLGTFRERLSDAGWENCYFCCLEHLERDIREDVDAEM